MKSTKWFQDAKLGLFIHWGLYSIRATGEWAIYREKIPKEIYRNYQRRFNPVRFDADEWVKAAREAGMKYIVFTSKHHDGFCMYDSKYTDWKVTNTPFGRDVLAEVVNACRKVGMRFGIYYSVWDLWHPGLDGGLSANIDADGKLSEHLDKSWMPSPEGVDYMHNQVEELCTRYGKIDIFWFDVKRASGECYKGEELIMKMRVWQPEMLINDRLGVPADLVTPENRIPETGIADEKGNPTLWESCMCLNDSWGYVRDDVNYKSPELVIRNLVEITSKGGNLLLNVGPDALGEFPKPYYQETFMALGEWLERNGEGIYGTCPYSIKPFRFFKWELVFTWKDNTLYIHIIKYPFDPRIVLPKIKGIVYEEMVLLKDGTEIRWNDENYLTLSKDEVTLELPKVQPYNSVTTIAVRLVPEEKLR